MLDCVIEVHEIFLKNYFLCISQMLLQQQQNKVINKIFCPVNWMM